MTASQRKYDRSMTVNDGFRADSERVLTEVDGD